MRIEQTVRTPFYC